MVPFAALSLVFKNETPTRKEETNIKKVIYSFSKQYFTFTLSISFSSLIQLYNYNSLQDIAT